MAVPAKSENYSFPRRNSNSNFSSKRNPASGNFSDVQSDIVISVDGVTFSLHKFPLFSRSGRIRKLAEELKESDSLANPMLEFSNFPGGPDTFELAAKFSYGMSFDITASNVAHLRCAGEFLEMTEEYGDENLIARSEAFLEEVILESVEKSAQVLHACEGILTWAEEVRVVNRCIDAIASKVCKEQMAYTLTRLEYNSSGRSNKLTNDGSSPLNVHNGHSPQYKATVEWWADDMSALRIDLYQRVLAAMKSRGLRIESIGGSLMHYAQKALKPLNRKKQAGESDGSRFKTKAFAYGVVNSKAVEHEQRILVESIVSMLPAERNLFPTNFLLNLLRTAIILDTTVACQLDLERRAGSQLEHASVDDILIPTYSSNAGDSLFDVEVVQRAVATYLQQDENHERLSSSGAVYDTDDLGSPSKRGLMKVSKLVDMYLAEIAPDSNLKVSKFLSLAELLPDYSRVIDDSLYRAIDIFLKAHPSMSDLERKKVCKLLDCQKLSQEACTHAAQNERLPVQLVVQVLYFEQLRMRSAMGGPRSLDEEQQLQSPSSGDGGVFNGKLRPRRMSGGLAASPRTDITANLRSDNRELKLEVARLRLRVNDLEKENSTLKQELALRPAPPVTGPGTTGNTGFFSLFSRKLGKMNFFTSQSRSSPKVRSGKARESKAMSRVRRHSIS